AVREGIFKREIVPVEIKSKKGIKIYDTDEHMIPDANLEAMGKLRPAFKKDGIVTAANASGLNDAAAAVVIMSKDKAKELGIKPLMKLINICGEGVDPKVMGLGPAVSIPKCLKQAGMKFEDIEYWEINEAFASQWLGVKRMLKEEFGIELNIEKVNHNGSGIALGHPVGCTGLRIVVSLYYELERLNLTLGGASLCVGGGPSMASLWTRDI
ncbi:MAG: acetyl-CoA acetyltransferase, partial [Desulfobacteraceae bacterium 4484_190.3]